MYYEGKTTEARVRINSLAKGWLRNYIGQECDALIYDEGVTPQINTEQLKPPLPKWQSAELKELDIIREVK